MSKAFSKIKYTGWLGLDDQLTYGKYFGLTVQEALKVNPEYICYLIDNTKINFYPSVHEEIDKLFPPEEFGLVPKEILYWQNVPHWKDEDVPF